MRSPVYTLKLQFKEIGNFFETLKTEKHTFERSFISMEKVYLSFKPHDFLCCGTKKSKEEEIGRGQCDWDKK